MSSPQPGAPSLNTTDATLAAARADALRDSISYPISRDSSILFLGAGQGGVMAALQRAGYSRIRGVASTPEIVHSLWSDFPDLAGTEFLIGPLPDVLAGIPDDGQQLVIVMPGPAADGPEGAQVVAAVGSDRLHDEIARISSAVLVLDDTGNAAATAPYTDRGYAEWAKRQVGDGATESGETVYRLQRMDGVDTLHRFWRQEVVPGNDARAYIEPIGRSEALLKLISDLPKDATILEVGCNVGRNLAFLHDNGYHNVQGVEINEHAVALLRETYPQLADAPIHVGTAGEQLPTLPDDSIDLVFTMAVIEHIHPSESTVFDDMVRLAHDVLVIEPTARLTHRQFPHKVVEIFTSRGMRQTLSKPMTDFPEWGTGYGLEEFVASRFTRAAG